MLRNVVVLFVAIMCVPSAEAKIIFVGSHGGYEAYTSYWDSGWTYDPLIMAASKGGERDTAEKVADYDSGGHGVDASIFFVNENYSGIIFPLISKDTASVLVGKGYVQQNYEEGDYVFLVGYSAGGKYVINLADALESENIPVHFLGMIDPIIGFNISIPENVEVSDNYLQRSEVTDLEGNSFFFYNSSETEYNAYLVTGPDMNHFLIDNVEVVWGNLGERMLCIAGSGSGLEVSANDDSGSTVNEEDSSLTSIGASDGNGLPGQGYETDPTEPPNPNCDTGPCPDFIVNNLWLETPGGVEKYEYSKGEEIKMKAQLKNIGDDDISGSDMIEARFYLSMGYKEDSHSDWIRVGTDFTQGDNLDPGETHTETEGLKLWEYPEIEAGKVYNIVACVDRIADSDNGDGDYEEIHKSNNCSTEAVFTVTAEEVPLSSGKSWDELTPGEQAAVLSIILE